MSEADRVTDPDYRAVRRNFQPVAGADSAGEALGPACLGQFLDDQGTRLVFHPAFPNVGGDALTEEVTAPARRQRITSSTTRPVGASLYSPVRRGISRRVRGMHQVLLAVPGLHTGGGGQLDGARGGVDSQGGVGDGIHRVIKLSGLKRVPRRIGGDSPFESHRHALADDQRTPGQDEPQSLPAAPKSA